MRTLLGLAIAVMVFIACGRDDDDRPPPPRNPTTTNSQNVVTPPPGPPGQVMVTVVANSTPQGATVTGGGRLLGTTPLSTQVPVPAPTPGQQQTFAFTFAMPNYQPATINASPVNNMITITAALAPMTMAVNNQINPVPVPVGGGAGGRVINVNGRGGGPITDNHTTTGTATVTDQCVISALSVRIVGTHTYFSDLAVSLRGPDGERYGLQNHTRANPFRTHNVRRAAGHSAAGEWTLSIADTVGQDSGALRDWGMTINCQ
jgi:hypothetical protein